MKKFFTTVFAVFLLCFVLGLSAQAEPVQRVRFIQRPLLNNPAILLQGGEFEMILNPEEGLLPESASLLELNDEEKVADLEISQTEGNAYSVTVPDSCPPGLYDLRVDFGYGIYDTQPHSVKVVSEFKDSFDFVHFTDIHFNSHHEGDPDVNPIRTRVLQEISALDPEFVLFSGDLGLDPETYPVDYVYGYEHFLAFMLAPMFMVPGNHELYVDNRPEAPIDGLDYWEATYGPTYLSFDYGKLHVAGINDFDWQAKYRDRWDQDLAFFGTQGLARISPEQWKWLVSDLESAHERGLLSMAFTHIPISNLQGGRKIGFTDPEKIKGPDPEMFVKLMNSFGVSHVFLGHLHYNELKDFDGLTQVMTVTAGSGDIREKWGFRVVHVKDGKITGWDIHEVGFDDL